MQASNLAFRDSRDENDHPLGVSRRSSEHPHLGLLSDGCLGQDREQEVVKPEKTAWQFDHRIDWATPVR
ncbi:hypothetical protein ACVCAH_05880 [Micromonospora sp. LZ34]